MIDEEIQKISNEIQNEKRQNRNQVQEGEEDIKANGLHEANVVMNKNVE